LHGSKFSILSADFNDGVRSIVQFIRCAGVGGNFVDDQIRIDDATDKFAAGSGGSDSVENKLTGPTLLDMCDGLKKGLNRPDRLAGSLCIKLGQHIVLMAD